MDIWDAHAAAKRADTLPRPWSHRGGWSGPSGPASGPGPRSWVVIWAAAGSWNWAAARAATAPIWRLRGPSSPGWTAQPDKSAAPEPTTHTPAPGSFARERRSISPAAPHAWTRDRPAAGPAGLRAHRPAAAADHHQPPRRLPVEARPRRCLARHRTGRMDRRRLHRPRPPMGRRPHRGRAPDPADPARPPRRPPARAHLHRAGMGCPQRGPGGGLMASTRLTKTPQSTPSARPVPLARTAPNRQGTAAGLRPRREGRIQAARLVARFAPGLVDHSLVRGRS